ncbi:MAG: PIG-L family deacetylase [Nostocaceae cyanobacterium]|nr:PIG-L family deacetylase [Nostocaceae cyanobacterium]
MLLKWILHVNSKPLTVSKKSAIVFAPHQDDETFGCGGIIALKSAHKIPVKVVFITDGRLSRPDWIPPKEIIHVRQTEAINALGILGLAPSSIYFLNQKDGSLKQLDSEQRKQLITQLVELLKLFKPEEVYVPHRQDCHPDHEATYSLVKEAISASGIPVEILQYPVWILWQNPLSFHLKLPEISRSYYISIAEVQDQKKQAIACYESQLTTLPHGLIKHFLSDYEIVIKH